MRTAHCRAASSAVPPMLQIFIWSKDYQENWSAFAPDFKVQP